MTKDQEQALSTLNPKPIEQQLQDLEGAILNGWVNPIDGILAVKKFQSLLDKLKKNINDSAIVELRSYPQGFEGQDGKVELRNSASRWSFKHIDVWNEKKKELSAIEELAKAAHNTGETIYDSEGVEISPAIKSGGGETVFVTLKK